MVSCVRLDGDDGDWFPIRTGLRQGCVMSPLLFNVYMDAMMRKVTEGTACGRPGLYRRYFAAGRLVVGDGIYGHKNGGSNLELRNKYQCEEERAAIYRQIRRQCLS